MKIDAIIKVVKPVNSCVLNTGTILDISIDKDYIDNYDDMIRAIETRLFDDYGVSLMNTEHYIIVNESSLCNEIFG